MISGLLNNKLQLVHTKSTEIALVLLILPLVASCQVAGKGDTQGPASHTSYQSGPGGFGNDCGLDIVCIAGKSGHEVLTRRAMHVANSVLDDGGPQSQFSVVASDEEVSGAFSQEPLVRGNYATDKEEPIPEFPLRQWAEATMGIPQSEPWSGSGLRQRFHALRGYSEDSSDPALLFTNQKSCEDLWDVIEKLSQKAVSCSSEASQCQAELYMGSALHAIQDSFSTEHVQRNEDLAIANFCKFGSHKVVGVCHHSRLGALVGGDFIWQGLVGSKRHQLKPDAANAVMTSAAYLVHMKRVLVQGATLEDELADFRQGSPKLRVATGDRLGATGSFTCNAIVEVPAAN